MDNIAPLFLYEPNASDIFSSLYLPLLIAILSIGIVFFLSKKEVSYRNRNLKNLGIMMSLFGILMSIGVAIFSFFNYQRMEAVKVFEQHLEVAGETLSFKDIKRVFLQRDFQSSHISPQIIKDTTFILVIEEYEDNKSHLFAEDYYPIKEMVVQINQQMEK